MWIYCIALVCLWVVDPAIRRLLDWRVGFHASQILGIVPVLGVAALLFAAATHSRTAVSRPILLLAWIWTSSFAYAGVLGMLQGHGWSSIYDLLQFLAPMFVALWLACDTFDLVGRFQQFAGAMLCLGVMVSVYGLVQFLALPPWDATWIRQVATVNHMVTNGGAQSLDVRVFSVLNSASVCASFLAVVIVLNLHTLKGPKLATLAGLFLCIATLVLTLERSAWVSLVIATVVYVLLSPNAGRTIAVGITCCIGVVALFLVASPWLMNHSGENKVFARMLTFASLEKDASIHARVGSTYSLLGEAVEHPLGEGLGIIGPASQLTSFTGAINAVDGGFQARFAEMGFAGFAGYVACMLLAMFFVFQRWRWSSRSGLNAESDALAALLAVQVMLMVLDLSIDSHLGLLGVLFWATIGIALAERKARKPELARDEIPLHTRSLVGAG